MRCTRSADLPARIENALKLVWRSNSRNQMAAFCMISAGMPAGMRRALPIGLPKALCRLLRPQVRQQAKQLVAGIILTVI